LNCYWAQISISYYIVFTYQYRKCSKSKPYYSESMPANSLTETTGKMKHCSGHKGISRETRLAICADIAPLRELVRMESDKSRRLDYIVAPFYESNVINKPMKQSWRGPLSVDVGTQWWMILGSWWSSLTLEELSNNFSDITTNSEFSLISALY
jgi:hypothetical protein